MSEERNGTALHRLASNPEPNYQEDSTSRCQLENAKNRQYFPTANQRLLRTISRLQNETPVDTSSHQNSAAFVEPADRRILESCTAASCADVSRGREKETLRLHQQGRRHIAAQNMEHR